MQNENSVYSTAQSVWFASAQDLLPPSMDKSQRKDNNTGQLLSASVQEEIYMKAWPMYAHKSFSLSKSTYGQTNRIVSFAFFVYCVY